MYDWILRYGKNQELEMRSGYEFATEELAKADGEEFVKNSNNHSLFGVEHYPNAKIETVEI